MRQAEVLYKKDKAGVLTQLDDASFVFKYHDRWFNDVNKPAISLTLPKTQQEYTSKHLFPFFIICYQKVLINKRFVFKIV